MSLYEPAFELNYESARSDLTKVTLTQGINFLEIRTLSNDIPEFKIQDGGFLVKKGISKFKISGFIKSDFIKGDIKLGISSSNSPLAIIKTFKVKTINEINILTDSEQTKLYFESGMIVKKHSEEITLRPFLYVEDQVETEYEFVISRIK